MATDTQRAFKAVSDIGGIEQLQLLAGENSHIRLVLPASERAAFAQLANDHIASVIARTDTAALVMRLRSLAAKHYVRHGDGYMLAADAKYAEREGTYPLIGDAFNAGMASGEINPGNMTMTSAMMDAEAAGIALKRADEYLAAEGYDKISFLGCGTFALSFQALHKPSGAVHVIKLIGWEMDERIIKGRPIPDNLTPIFDSVEGMPEPSWSLAAFPKVLPLVNIADELGPPALRISVSSPPGADGEPAPDPEDFVVPGAFDLISEMFVNSMSENCFPLDDPRPAIGLLPEGNLALFDMGAADYEYIDPERTVPNGTYNVKYWTQRDALYAPLGAPFRMTDDRGVPLSVGYFQPGRYKTFVASANRGVDAETAATHNAPAVA